MSKILTTPAAENRFAVGGWRVHPRALSARRADGEERRLEPRVMALLVCLARHAGRPVTREELLEEVWSDVVVADDAIHSAVSKLRRALGDGLVETVPKVGYRLAVAVERLDHLPSPGDDGKGAAPPDAGGRPRNEPPATDAPRARATPRPLLAWALPVLVAGALALAWSLRPGAPAGPAAPPRIEPVTSWPGLEVEPAFAPGPAGDRIAFAWRGPQGENWDIWVRVPGEGDPLRLTHHPGSDHHPAWSPDGRRLAFIRYHDGGCSLLSVPSLGGAERRLAGCIAGEGLAWSPRGELFFSERPAPGEPFRIVALDPDTGAQRQVTRPAPGSLGDLGPAVSPDGSTLAFLRSPVLGVEDLHLLPLDPPPPAPGAVVAAAGVPVAAGPAAETGTAARRRLTHDDLKIHGAAWEPDGRGLVFSSNRGGLFSLWRIGVEGGEPRWLGAGGGDLDAPSVGGDGRIAYEQWNDDTNLYRLDLASGTTTPLLAAGSTRWEWGADAGGGRVVFVSDRSGAPELWSVRGDGAPARRLTDFGGPYVDRPRVAPDGERVAFDARPSGNADVYLLPGEGTPPLRLTDHPAQDVAPSWSRDGASILFASDRDGSWQVWRVPAAGGEPERVTRRGGYLARESADGRWLYFSRRHERGLWRLPLGADGVRVGEPERLTPDLVPLDRGHWLLAGDALLYLRRPRHDRPVLARLDLGTGAVRDLAELGSLPYNSGLALTDGGDAVLFSRCDRWEADIMLLERGLTSPLAASPTWPGPGTERR